MFMLVFVWTLAAFGALLVLALVFWAGVSHGQRLGLPTYEVARLRWDNRLLRREVRELEQVVETMQVSQAVAGSVERPVSV